MPAEMPREFEERGVLFAHIVENADRADSFRRQPDDLAPRAAELPLQRLHLRNRQVEVLLKKFLENIHECAARFRADESQSR